MLSEIDTLRLQLFVCTIFCDWKVLIIFGLCRQKTYMLNPKNCKHFPLKNL